MALASARIGAMPRITAADRTTPGSPVSRHSRAKARVSSRAFFMVGRRLRQVLGEASASLMKVIETMASTITATRATAESNVSWGESI